MLAFLSAVALAGSPARAEEPYRPLKHMESGAADLWQARNAWVLLGGFGAAYALHVYDNDVKTHFAGYDRLRGWDRVGTVWGSGAATVLVGAGLLSYGYFGHQRREREAGLGFSEGALANTLATETLKLAVGRERPNRRGNDSFPSGHSSNSFAMASSLQQFYGWGVGAPMFAMAAFTAYCRLAANVHYLSDVIAGATIGTIFGWTYAQHHLNGPLSPERDIGATGHPSAVRRPVAEIRWAPFFDSRRDWGLAVTVALE